MQPERRSEDGEATLRLVTRRRVLAGAVAATICATVPNLGSAAAANAPSSRLLTRGLTRARFAPHAGTSVTLRAAGAPAVPATLVGVEDLAGDAVRHLAGSPDAYALRVRVRSSSQLLGGTVGIRHPRFGAVALFVTPSSRTARYQDYIAVINRVLR
jgi:hypothetical protein